MPTPIRVAQLSKSFGLSVALREVTFNVGAGEVVAVFGPNGAGKTTLLKCLSGLTRPSSGEVEILGGDPRRDSRIRRSIGLVSHTGFLSDPFTAYENLRMMASFYDVPNPDLAVGEALALVNLTDRAHDRVRGFSRGMRQRLAIARATLHKPSLLFLDEPYTGLDRAAASALTTRFRALAGTQQTVVMVSHELELGLSLATRVIVLVSGRIVLDRPTKELDHSRFERLYLELVEGGAA